MSEQFWIKNRTLELPIAVLELGGHIGGTAAQEILDRCQKLAGDGYHHLIIKMDKVAFIASSGTGALVILSEQYRILGGSIHIVAPSSAVSRVLDILNLHHFVDSAKDVEDALEQLRTRQS